MYHTLITCNQVIPTLTVLLHLHSGLLHVHLLMLQQLFRIHKEASALQTLELLHVTILWNTLDCGGLYFPFDLLTSVDLLMDQHILQRVEKLMTLAAHELVLCVGFFDLHERQRFSHAGIFIGVRSAALDKVYSLNRLWLETDDVVQSVVRAHFESLPTVESIKVSFLKYLQRPKTNKNNNLMMHTFVLSFPVRCHAMQSNHVNNPNVSVLLPNIFGSPM